MRPLVEAAGDWVCPDGLARRDPLSHFGGRALARGVQSVPGDLLKWIVERAVREAREDVAERMFSVAPACYLYRVDLPEGLFYPVVRYCDGGRVVAVTIYTQRMAGQVRKERKDWRRKRPVRKHARCGQ